jgi:hypothetical protein
MCFYIKIDINEFNLMFFEFYIVAESVLYI